MAQRAQGEPRQLRCPFCGSRQTEKAADFGTSVMVRLHYCRACRSHFEAIKWGDTTVDLDVPAFLAHHKKQRFPLPIPHQARTGSGKRGAKTPQGTHDDYRD